MKNHKTQSSSNSIFDNQRIAVGGWYNAEANQIIFLEADINYTKIHLANGCKKVVATSLKILEKRFAFCEEFFRTHRSFMINLNYIEKYDAENNEVSVKMKNGFQVKISRRKKEAFQKRILTISQTI